MKPHPFADEYPAMTSVEYDALVRDIKLNGLRFPIIAYEGQILDGRHRYRACSDLGIAPRVEMFSGDEKAARKAVESLNLHRRHMTIAQRKEIAMRELKADTQQSDRAIAKTAGVDHKTVAKARAEAAANGEVPHKTERAEASGRKARAVQRGDVVRAGFDRAVQKVVEKCGLKISRSKGEGSISAVGTLVRVYDRGGAATLNRALLLAFNSFGDPGLSDRVIDGMARVCERYNGAIDDADAVERFKTMRGGVGALLQRAETLRKQVGASIPQCVAAAIIDTLNAKRGGKKIPSWWKE
jgi:hypothetical protein